MGTISEQVLPDYNQIHDIPWDQLSLTTIQPSEKNDSLSLNSEWIGGEEKGGDQPLIFVKVSDSALKKSSKYCGVTRYVSPDTAILPIEEFDHGMSPWKVLQQLTRFLYHSWTAPFSCHVKKYQLHWWVCRHHFTGHYEDICGTISRSKQVSQKEVSKVSLICIIWQVPAFLQFPNTLLQLDEARFNPWHALLEPTTVYEHFGSVLASEQISTSIL